MPTFVWSRSWLRARRSTSSGRSARSTLLWGRARGGGHDEARLRAVSLARTACQARLTGAACLDRTTQGDAAVSGPEAATQQRAKATASTTAGGIVGTRSSRRRAWGTLGTRSGRAHGEPAAFWARIRPFQDTAGRHLQGPGEPGTRKGRTGARITRSKGGRAQRPGKGHPQRSKASSGHARGKPLHSAPSR